MTNIICPECGAENEPSAQICVECGVSLTVEHLIENAEIEEPIGDELDRLSEAETDLPGLLHALKQEDSPPDKADEGDHSENEDTPSESHLVDEQKTQPGWLDRIRQRVNEEEDASGEMVQKLSAAQESLAQKKKEGQDEDFSSWIKQLREEPTPGVDEQEPKEEPQAEGDLEEREETPDWLDKIRKIGGVSHADQDEYSVPGGDSLLQWLMDLEEGKELLKGIPKPGLDFLDDGYEGIDESLLPGEGFDGGATQEMRIKSGEVSVINITRDEQAQADQLQATIVDEKAVRQIQRTGRRPLHWFRRVFFALLLIGGVTLTLITGAPQRLVDRPLKPQNQALLTWAAEKRDVASYLLVFEYEAAYSQEMTLIAQPVLELLIDETTEISVISTSVSGKLLAHRLLSGIEAVDEFDYADLGYYPVASYGAYGLLSRGQGTWPFGELPDLIHELPLESFDGILILSGSDESTRSWVEQLSILAPATPVHLILTAQAGPMLVPYWESGQVSGIISGLSEAAAVEALHGEGSDISVRWRAYQVGILLLIAVMLIGAFFVVERTPNEDRGQHE